MLLVFFVKKIMTSCLAPLPATLLALAPGANLPDLLGKSRAVPGSVRKDGKWDQVFNWSTKGKPGGKWVNPPTEPIQLVAP